MSNTAESVSVLIQDFKFVGIQEDGMRPYNSSLSPYGISFYDATTTGYNWTSDGDVGTLIVGSGTVNAYAKYYKPCTMGTFNTSTFDVVTVRAKCIDSNVSWYAEVYDTDDAIIGTITPQTSSEFVTANCYLPSGHTVDAIVLCGMTTNGNTGRCGFDYLVLSSERYPQDSLVLSMNMNEGSGTEVHDKSGNGNHGTVYGNLTGTVYGATWVDGKYGKALWFHNSEVIVPHDNSLTGFSEFTIAYWIQPVENFGEEPDNWYFWVGKDWDWQEYCLGWQGWSDSFLLSFDDESGTRRNYDAPAGFQLEAGKWYLVVGTYDGEYLRIYVNGTELGSGAYVGSHTIPSQNCNLKVVGANKKIIFDDVRIYNRALSASEIADLYNGVDIGGGRVLCLRFDEGSGNTVYSDNWCDGKYGTALNFDGVNDYVDISNTTDMRFTRQTLVVWVKPDYQQEGSFIYSKDIIRKGDEWGISTHFEFNTNGQLSVNYRYFGGEDWWVTCETPLNIGEWNFIAVVWDKSQSKVFAYVNGVEEEFQVTSGTLYIQNNLVRLGFGYAGYFKGDIDDVRIYNRALSADEIQRLYTTTGPSSYPVTVTVTDASVENKLSDGIDTADFSVVQNTEFDIVPDVNDHVKIWLSKGTTVGYRKVFTGVVDRATRAFDGKKIDIKYECSGYGRYLSKYNIKMKKKGNVTSILLALLSMPIKDGKITACSIQSSSDTITIDTGDDEKNLLDVLRDVTTIDTEDRKSSLLDWDFYVDLGSDFHAFQRGILPPINMELGNDILSFDYVKDITRLVNSQVVIGRDSYGYGGDSEWTENTIGWGVFPGGAGTVVARTDKPLSVLELGIPIEGNYSLVFGSELYNGTDFYFERTLSTTIDVRFGGKLRFLIKTLSVVPRTDWYVPYSLDLDVFCYTSPTDYFVANLDPDVRLHGGIAVAENMILDSDYKAIMSEWWEAEVGLTDRFDVKWTKVGDPDWASISLIRFRINEPKSYVGKYMLAWIDGMTISNVRYWGTWEDTESIGTYGLHKGEFTYRSDLESFEECTIAAYLIVNAYKDPIVTIENLSTSKFFDGILGQEYIFSTLDVNSTISLRSIRHKVEGLQMESNVTLSNRYIPTPDKLIAVMKKQLSYVSNNVDMWKTIITRSRQFGGGLVDWWDLDPGVGSWLFMNANGLTMTGTEGNFVYATGSPEPQYYFNYGEVGLYGPSGGVGNYTQIVPGTVLPSPKIFSNANTITLFTQFEVNTTSAISTRAIVGNITDGGFGVETNGSILYGVSYKAGYSEYSTLALEDISANTRYNVKAIYFPSNKISFFVNNNYKGDISTNLPENYMQLFTFKCQNLSTGTARRLKIYRWNVTENT